MQMRTLKSDLKFLLYGFVFSLHLGMAQTIQFSIYVESELTATKQQDMDFQTVVSDQGLTPIYLGDPGMGVFGITGNEELDVIISLDVPPNLTHTGGSPDVIPLTLQFAYANQGNNDIIDAVIVPGNSVRIPLRGRDSGPPGPPPTPPHSQYTPSETTAYIYLFGSINVGAIDAGAYTGTVTLTVEYD